MIMRVLTLLFYNKVIAVFKVHFKYPLLLSMSDEFEKQLERTSKLQAKLCPVNGLDSFLPDKSLINGELIFIERNI